MGSIRCVTGLFLIRKHNSVRPRTLKKCGVILIVPLLIAVPPCLSEETSPHKGTLPKTESTERLAKKALEYLSSKQWDKSIRLDEEALSIGPSEKLKVDILFDLSFCYLQKGIISYGAKKDDQFYQQALDYAERCLAMDPHHWQAFENMAIIYGNMKNLEVADFYYKKAERYVELGSEDFTQLIAHHNIIREGIRARQKQQ